jgi:hypothetical protein
MAITSGHFMTQFWHTYSTISKPRVFPSEAAQETLKKKTFSNCIFQNLTDRDYRNLQGILPDLMLDCSLLRACRLTPLTALGISAN